MRSANLRGTRKIPCSKCRGTGKVLNDSVMSWGWKTCPDCKGLGYIEYRLPPPQYGRRF